MSTKALTLHQYAASSSPLIKKERKHSIIQLKVIAHVWKFILLNGQAGQSIRATNKLRQML